MSSSSEQTLQYRPLESSETFRLLRYVPKSGPSDPLSLDLIHVTSADIASIRHYMAVSYAWGDPTPAHTFRIDGSLCHLPKSSFEFLQSLCDLSTKSYWWIDAICINQADLAEKAVQIPLMKQIYSNAAIVWIWLGPSTKESRLALQFLRKARDNFELDELNDVDKARNLEWFLTKTTTTIGSRQWQAVADLFCKPWFSRLWCIQEVVLTTKMMVFDGSASCNWNELVFGRLALTSGIYPYLRLRGLLKGTSAFHFESVARLQMDFHNHHKRDHTFKSFTRMWYQTWSYQATNLVDYVYGVLGLISSESESGPAIVPDYRKSNVEVFAEAISFCLRRDNNYDVLSLAGVGFVNQSKSLDALPSWLPNFALIPTPGMLVFHENYPNRAGLSPLESVELKPDFSFENGRLMVKGAIVDKIVEFIADVHTDKRTLDDKENDICTWSRRALAAIHESPRFNISTPESWEKWARTLISHWAWPTESDESRWLTRYVKIYESFLKVWVNNPQVQGLHTLDAREVVKEDNNFSEDEKREARHYDSAIASLQWKRIAVTERGDLAIVQRLSKLGDEVCILPSGKVPLLIRQMPDTGNGSSQYQLVGESYVDGLMLGEGLSMAPLQDIVLA